VGSASSLTWLGVVVLSTDGTIGSTPTEKLCSASAKDDSWDNVVPGAGGSIHTKDSPL